MNDEKVCMNCDNWSISGNDGYYGICEYRTNRAIECTISYDHIADDCKGFFYILDDDEG
jgi:hypothetical protein